MATNREALEEAEQAILERKAARAKTRLKRVQKEMKKKPWTVIVETYEGPHITWGHYRTWSGADKASDAALRVHKDGVTRIVGPPRPASRLRRIFG